MPTNLHYDHYMMQMKFMDALDRTDRKESEMGMTRADYQDIAQVLNNSRRFARYGAQREFWTTLRNQFMSFFQNTRPNFDSGRFAEACGVIDDEPFDEERNRQASGEAMQYRWTSAPGVPIPPPQTAPRPRGTRIPRPHDDWMVHPTAINAPTPLAEAVGAAGVQGLESRYAVINRIIEDRNSLVVPRQTLTREQIMDQIHQMEQYNAADALSSQEVPHEVFMDEGIPEEDLPADDQAED